MEARTRLKARLPEPVSIKFDPSVHDVAQFDCGNAELNRWLIESAFHSQSIRTSNTFVFVRNNQVIGYYSIAAHQVLVTDLPKAIAHGSPRISPAYIIGKLAVAKFVQGQSIGGSLLADALLRLCRAADSGPSARFIAVDAIDENAEAFYRHHGFKSTSTNTREMYLKISTARDAVTPG